MLVTITAANNAVFVKNLGRPTQIN